MTGFGLGLRGIRALAIACAAATTATLAVVAPADAVEAVTPVASCDELGPALAASGTVVLTQSVSGPQSECGAVEVGAGADVVLDLATFSLYVGDLDAQGPATAEHAAILVPSDASLTVRGVNDPTGEQGILVVRGGDGAGIGARPGSGASGDIRLEGGVIYAYSRSAAGIGGADGDARVEIAGGVITAFSSFQPPYVDSGAGIGGGLGGTGVVEITGGAASGWSWSGAGIGGGSDGDGVVTVAVPEGTVDAGLQNASGGSRTGAGIGGGVRGAGEVVITGGTVSGLLDGLDAPGAGLGDPSRLGSVTISGRPSVGANSIRSGRIEILGGSVNIPDGLPATSPRPVAGTTALSPIFVAVRKDGVPVTPGPELTVVDSAGVPTGYEAITAPYNSASLWLPPGRAWIRAEVDGERRTFPVTVAADGSGVAYLDFGTAPTPTLKERIVARFAELARRLGDDDAAITRIARELGISESTVRLWLRRAGRLG